MPEVVGKGKVEVNEQIVDRLNGIHDQLWERCAKGNV